MKKYKLSTALAVGASLAFFYTIMNYGLLLGVVLFIIPVVFLWGSKFLNIDDFEYWQKWIVVGIYTLLRTSLLAVFYVAIIKDVLFVHLNFTVHSSYLVGIEGGTGSFIDYFGNELNLGFVLRVIAFLPVVLLEGMVMILPPYYREKYGSVAEILYTSVGFIIIQFVFYFLAMNILNAIFNVLLPLMFG